MYVRIKVTCGFRKQSAESVFVAGRLSGPVRILCPIRWGHLLNATGDAAPEMAACGITCLSPCLSAQLVGKGR